jgi:hypothetical protein
MLGARIVIHGYETDAAEYALHVRYHAPHCLALARADARAEAMEGMSWGLGGSRIGQARSEETLMQRTHNGMRARDLPAVTWQKSRRSNPSGNCVELAALPGERAIAIRNSRDPDGPVLIYTVDEIAAFVLGVQDGEFDDLVR